MEAPIQMSYTELESMLRPLIRQQLQQQQQASANTGTQLHDSDLDPVFSSLLKLIPKSDEALAVPGIPLPEVDEQLGPLQQEVEAVLQRLSVHRKEVPSIMASALEQQLRELRPKTTLQKVATEPVSDTAESDLDQSKQLEEAQQLHQAVKEAVNKLPALRARLEEMSVRLGRNLEAVGAEQASALEPPRTVERVLRGVAAGKGLGPASAGAAAADDL